MPLKCYIASLSWDLSVNPCFCYPQCRVSLLPLPLGLAPRRLCRRRILDLRHLLDSLLLLFHVVPLIPFLILHIPNHLLRSGLALRIPALHQTGDLFVRPLLAIPCLAPAAPPLADILDRARARRRLPVYKSAFGANQDKAVFGLCFVLAQQRVEDAVVPVCLRE